MLKPILLFSIWLIAGLTAHSQSLAYAKVYLGYSPFDLQTTLDPNIPLQIGTRGFPSYTLLETDLDTLIFMLPKKRTALLQLEAGRTYYYNYDNRGYQDVSANAFWLTQAATSARRYYHYILTRKSGVVKANDSDD